MKNSFLPSPVNKISDSCLVVFSGGQDSTTVLYWAKKYFKSVVTLTFDYGQIHKIEIEQAKIISEFAKVRNISIDISSIMQFNSSALLNGSSDDLNSTHPNDSTLPASFVPGRNILFLTIASSIAYAQGIKDICVGICETDSAGYPDCREHFKDQIQIALSSGLGSDVSIHAPLLKLSKSQTWGAAKELGILDLIIDHSHTDYRGNRATKNPWGYGELDNSASKLRAEGYFEALKNGWL